MKTHLYETFQHFETGMFSAPVGPLTEYHFLAEAAPKHGWAVACFGTGPEAGSAWHVVEEDGVKAMRQTHTNDKPHTHPMLTAGDPLWGDMTLTARFRPESNIGRCGVVVRYHNNRCYLFFGLEGKRLVLLRVHHEKAFHVPDEVELAAVACDWRAGACYTARVTVRGAHIHAEIEGPGAAVAFTAVEGEDALAAGDSTCQRGKIGLLSDGPATFFAVTVTAEEPAVQRFNLLKSRAEREIEALREQYARPVAWRRLSTRGFGVGRNLRFGDLDGDGQLEIAVGQVIAHGPRDAYSEVGCITAIRFNGEIMWQSGMPDPANWKLTNDVAFQIHDINGDGRGEVIYARDFELVVADGTTGQVINKAPTPMALEPATRYPRILGDCLFFADFRGVGRATDIVIKDRYWHFWVYDDRLELQWQGACNTGHYPAAFDVDGDGRDELAIGYNLYDHDGTLLWSLEDVLHDHADGIAVVDWLEKPGSKPKILYAASDEGLLLVDLQGHILKHHRIGHAQNPAIARLRTDLPGLQAVSVNFWGNQGILHFYDGEGAIYHNAEPLNMGSMCLPVNWTGREPELFVLNANPVYGGMFDGWGRPVVMFPPVDSTGTMRHPDLCYAVLDVTGDCRDEVVVWDPNELWVYTQDDAAWGQPGPRTGRLPAVGFTATGRRYKPVRNPLYNCSNYQATVSLPGWSEE
ncbi:MAG: hypothetical protein JXM73_14260 [Anaerolineae bacterium]|nr:hypothetical protein [Anaerolineae bacterium]